MGDLRAGIDPLVSPEWTFTNAQLIAVVHETKGKSIDPDSPTHKELLQKLYKYYSSRINDGFISKIRKSDDRTSNFYIYIAKYDLYFHFESDVNVIEVKPLIPIKYSRWISICESLQKDILFDPLAREFQLLPQRIHGGNHINIDFSELPSKLLPLAVSDAIRYPFLFRETFPEAIPPSLQPKTTLEKFIKNLSELAMANHPQKKFSKSYYDLVDDAFFNLAKESYLVLGRKIYVDFEWWSISLGMQLKFHTYKGVLNESIKTLCLEYRGAPPSTDVKTWFLEVQLLVERLKYLNTFDSVPSEVIVGRYPQSKAELSSQLREYLKPTGLRLEDYGFIAKSWAEGMENNAPFITLLEETTAKLNCARLAANMSKAQKMQSKLKSSPKFLPPSQL